MHLQSLDQRALRSVYQNHIKRDFPIEERKPLFIMERLIRQGKYDPLGIYEGENLLAYALLWHDGVRDYILLDYLAVCDGRRGKGVGAAVLSLLEEHYRDYRGILAEAEAPGEDAGPEENKIRARRQAFYLRAGFQQLGYQAKLFGVVYDMLSSGEADRAAAITAHRRLYCGEAYARRTNFVEIPYEKS